MSNGVRHTGVLELCFLTAQSPSQVLGVKKLSNKGWSSNVKGAVVGAQWAIAKGT